VLYYPWWSATTTQAAGTITTGGTFQTALAASTGRHGCLIQNQSSHVMFVYMGTLANATEAKSYQITALGGVKDTFPCNQGPFVLTDAVNITTSANSDPYVVLSW